MYKNSTLDHLIGIDHHGRMGNILQDYNDYMTWKAEEQNGERMNG